ncbi:MAG TPA: alpha/beta family hydrolase [Chthoniobacterales bacterium]|nr:alpha/beta family hydrolase [Chthoniobacterales bacterium]
MKLFFLLAPGAGAPSSHPWMQRWKKRLEEIGPVETFDYDYMREGRKRPDRLPQLIQAHRAALAEARKKFHGPIFLIGKSMGGRVGCHVSLEAKVSGVICLGYPLCAMGERTKLRDEVLLALRAPALFVQGTRDTLCPLDLLESVRIKMTAPNFLHAVEGGDHSLLVRKKDLGDETQEDVDQRILRQIRDFAGQVSENANPIT